MCVPSGACGFDPGCDSNDITSYVNDGDTTVDFDCDGDPDYCSGSIWYDCYDDNQCPSGYSCVNNDCVDATPPQYSLNSTNSTLAGSAVEHRLKWTDNVGLSGYIFNFCNGTCNTEWALPGFKRCRNITISSPINDYQYKLILNTTNFNYSYANDDGSDIRIVNASCGNGGVEVPYWIEKWNKTGESTIWFRGDNSSTTTYAIYYNNTQAESKSNGAKTFIFFDDFNNLNNWNNPYPSYYTITTVDGRSVLKMTYPSGSTSGHLAAKTPVSGIVNKEVVYSARWWGGNSDMDDTVGYGPSGTSKTYYAYQSLGDTSTSYGKHRVFLEGGSYVKGSVNAQSSWKTAKMWINTTSDVWGYYDGELLHGTGSLSHTTGYLRFDIDPDSTSRGMYYDWIFVKKYTTTEPTTTLGEEESSSWVSDPWTPFPSGGTSDWSNVTKIINSTPGAVIKWCVYANDTSNNWNITSCDNPFTYIATAPPYYFDPKVLPSSGSTYSPSQSYQFNATWIDLDGGTIDKVWLYANFSGNFENYLVTTRDGDEYYYNIPNLAAGTYSYKWYANDTDGNVNNSFPMTTYVVNKATPSGHQTVSPGWTVTYPTETTVTCYLDVGDTGTSLTLKRDGITVATGSQPSETVTLGYKSDGHTYTCEYPGSQNYTSTTLDTDILTVNKGTPSLTLSCTGSKYPDDPSCTASESNNGDNDCTYNLYVGGILEDSGSSISWSGDRGAGTYNVAYNTTGCTNYTNNEVTDSFTVSKGSLSGSITVNDVKYPNDLTVSTSDTNPGDSDVEYEVYCEEILIASSIGSTPCESGCSKDYAVGSYTCKLNTTSSTFANWTSNSSIATDSGNVNPGTLQLSISGGGTFTYPHKTTVFGSESNPGDNDVTYQLWRDSALVDSTEPWSETILLGVGTYVYRFNATGGQNWTANSTGVTTTVTITQNTSTQNYMNLTIGVGTLGTEGDREYEIGSSINVTGWFDSSAFVGPIPTFTLYKNSSVIGSSNPISYINTYTSLGTFKYTYNTSGNSNYSSAEKTYYLTIVDTTPPTITWESPTPGDGEATSNTWIYLNTTITDMTNTSAFFDWNQSLVGYWSFEYYNSSGIYDNSTYNNFGKFKNGLSTSDITNGKYGHGLRFDGSNDYIALPMSYGANSISETTVCAWVKSSSSNDQIIASFDRSEVWRLALKDDRGTGNVGWDTTDYAGTTNDLTTSQDYADGKWHFICGWFKAGESPDKKIYVDGSVVASTTAHGGNNLGEGQERAETYGFIGVGSEAGSFDGTTGPNYYFNGIIDEVRIYNRALSDEEILSSYNNALYRLYHNFTGLTDGIYNYTAWAIDQAGNMNKSQRYVNVSLCHPISNVVLDIDLTCNDFNLGPGLVFDTNGHTLNVIGDAIISGTFYGRAANQYFGSLNITSSGNFEATTSDTIVSEDVNIYGTYTTNNGNLTVGSNFNLYGTFNAGTSTTTINGDFYASDTSVFNDESNSCNTKLVLNGTGAFHPRFSWPEGRTGCVYLAYSGQTTTLTNSFYAWSLYLNGGSLSMDNYDAWLYGYAVSPYHYVYGDGTITSTGGMIRLRVGHSTNNIWDNTVNIPYLSLEPINCNSVDDANINMSSDMNVQNKLQLASGLSDCYVVLRPNGHDINVGNLTINAYAQLLVYNSENISISDDLIINSNGILNITTGFLNVSRDATIYGTLDGGSGDHRFGSLTIESGGVYEATSGTTTITKRDANDYAVYVKSGGELHANSGTFNLTSDSIQFLRGLTGSNALHNVYTYGNGQKVFWDLNITGNLTIYSKDFRSYNTADYLTVDGDVIVKNGGILGYSAATRSGNYTFGSLTIESGGTYYATNATTTITNENSNGYAIQMLGGNVYHNNGKTKIVTNDDTNVDWYASQWGCYDVEIDMGTHTLYFYNNNLNQIHDLTITSGIARSLYNNGNFGTTGSVTIRNGGTLGHSGWSGNASFGALIIESGGTYEGTSGITSLIGSGTVLNIDGNFNHNEGTVKIDGSGSTNIYTGGATFYDLNIYGSSWNNLYEDMTVLHNFTTNVQSVYAYNSPTLIFGNSTLSAMVDAPTLKSSSNLKIYAADEAHPVIFKSQPDWFVSGRANTWYLKWVDFETNNVNITTSGDGVDSVEIVVEGNSSFSSINLSSGDVFNITSGSDVIMIGILEPFGNFNVINGSLINVTVNSTKFVLKNAQNVKINPLYSYPSDPSGQHASNIGKYVNISSLGTGSTDLNITYSDDDLGSVVESSLNIYKYDGVNWNLLSNSNIDTVNNWIWAAGITSFGVFAPMGNTPPTIWDIAPLTSGHIADQTYNITWRAGDDDLDNLTFKIYYSTIQGGFDNIINNDLKDTDVHCDIYNGDTECWYLWDTSGISKGDYYITINVTDGYSEETNSSQNTLKVDHAPVASLNSPEDNSVKGETSVVLNVTVTDPDGDSMDVRFYDSSGTLIGIDSNVPSGSFAATSWSGLSDGLYQWYVNVTDGLLTTTSDTWMFYVDTTPPQITWEPPTPGDGVLRNKDWVYLNTTITDMTNTSAFFDWNRSLVGYWSFEYYNSSGIYDNSTYDNFGAFNGGLSTSDITTGKYGHGLRFDGSNDYINSGNDESLNITDEITIEAWVKPIITGQHGIIGGSSSYGGSYQLYLRNQTNAMVGFWFNDGTQRKTLIRGNVQNNVWTHIVAVYDGVNMIIYINGIPYSGTPITGTETVNYDGVKIGYIPWVALPNYFNGIIDEVRIYNRALSDEEIKASYNNGLYRLEHNFTGLSDGLYNYTAYAIDQVGHMNKTLKRGVTIDSIPPSINIITPENTTYDVNYLDVNVTTNENANWCKLNLDNSGSNVSMSYTGSEWYYQLAGLSTGTYQLYVYCSDLAGNVGLNNSIWFTVLWECINGKVLYWDNATPVANANIDLKVYDENMKFLGEGTGTTDSQGNYHICLSVDMRARQRYLVNVTATKGSYHSYLKYYVRRGE